MTIRRTHEEDKHLENMLETAWFNEHDPFSSSPDYWDHLADMEENEGGIRLPHELRERAEELRCGFEGGEYL